MSIRITCPECSAQFPFAAGVLDDDGKRLAVLTGEMEPALARAAMSYLRFFKPAKTSLRTSRAVVILQELQQLVAAGTVCKDERGGIRRPATFRAWIAGIEQMHQTEARLTLPLANHNYLRSIVFGIADGMDAKTEKARDAEVRHNARPSIDPRQPIQKVDLHREMLDGWLVRGIITKAEYEMKLHEHTSGVTAMTTGPAL